MTTSTNERRWSISSTVSSLSSRKDVDAAPIRQADDDGRRESIARHWQPGSDWTSTRVRRAYQTLLIVLPSLPLLVAALVSSVLLHHRYDVIFWAAETSLSCILRATEIWSLSLFFSFCNYLRHDRLGELPILNTNCSLCKIILPYRLLNLTQLHMRLLLFCVFN